MSAQWISPPPPERPIKRKASRTKINQLICWFFFNLTAVTISKIFVHREKKIQWNGLKWFLPSSCMTFPLSLYLFWRCHRGEGQVCAHTMWPKTDWPGGRCTSQNHTPSGASWVQNWKWKLSVLHVLVTSGCAMFAQLDVLLAHPQLGCNVIPLDFKYPHFGIPKMM